MGRLIWIAVLVAVGFSSNVVAELQGTITTIDGQRYEVSGFGSPSNPKDYYIKTNQGFIPLAEVRQISRAGSGLVNSPSFYIITKQGKILQGKIGLLFFNRVIYRDAASGVERIGYEAVIKGRGSDGLLFTSLDADEHRVHHNELYNPNDVMELVLWASK